MLNFLKQTRKLVNAKEPVCIVLGNESCDLDSAVCAISVAYFYQHNENSKLSSTTSNYIPLLNIPKSDYPLKTEVKHIFEEIDIKEEFLIFRDELCDEFLNNNTFILVDHHVSPWIKSCVAIYDHRPKDKHVCIPDECVQHISLVGSCATLVAEEFINLKMLMESEKEFLSLLRSTIILDTVNFSVSAGRATPKDIEICLALEEVLKKFINLQSREKIFESLIKARADVSSLTALQLLRKDFKVLTSSKNEKIKVALPVFPLPVEEFILKCNAVEAVNEFVKEYKCSVILLMGMYVNHEDGSVRRDFGLINISDTNLCQSIQKCLLTSNEPKLSAEYRNHCNFMNGSFYEQKNIKVTRKHIIPIVKTIMEQ